MKNPDAASRRSRPAIPILAFLLVAACVFISPLPRVAAWQGPQDGSDASINLHIHTYCSDGSDTPEQVVDLAKGLGIRTLAITDHDTVACVDRAEAEGRKTGVRVVPGIEVSAGDDSMHILGLNVDIHNASLQKLIESNGRSRVERARQTVALLNNLKARDRAVRIDFKEILLSKINIERETDNAPPLGAADAAAMSDDQLLNQTKAPVTRPDIARVLVEKGYVRNSRQAFDTYLGDAGSAAVEFDGLSFQEVIRAIHDAGGLAVLAHPYTIYKFHKFPQEYSGKTYPDFNSLLADMLAAGLDGVEQYKNRKGPNDNLVSFANEQGGKLGRSILYTPGSDYHGHSGVGQPELAAIAIPQAEAAKILKALRQDGPAPAGVSAAPARQPSLGDGAELGAALGRTTSALGGPFVHDAAAPSGGSSNLEPVSVGDK